MKIRVDDLLPHAKALELVNRLNSADDRKWTLIVVAHLYGDQACNHAVFQGLHGYQGMQNSRAMQ